MFKYNIFVFLLLAIPIISGRLINYEEEGAIPDDESERASWTNGILMNKTLGLLQPGDVFLVPDKTFYLMGGIKATGLKSVVIQIDGRIFFSNAIDDWPRQQNGNVLECMHFYSIENVTFTSSGMGTLDGQGATWWGFPGIGYLVRGEDRPRIINVQDSKDILFENLFFLSSPYWTFWVHSVDGLEVRNCHIDNRRDGADEHNIIDLTAFNTDGFDVSGKNVWIHDCSVWTQDDCIAVKGDSENMLFERITASGVGLTIGSIGTDTLVNNITFRDCNMHHTWKGIYMKFRGGNPEVGALVSNVLYENIYMDGPTGWSIWIGPAQQSDSSSLCAANGGCSLCWPQIPSTTCEMDKNFVYENITLRNITIVDPQFSYGMGVVLGHEETPMKNIVFDGVRVIGADNENRGEYYTCEGVSGGVALGDTYPVPSCFEDQTDRN